MTRGHHEHRTRGVAPVRIHVHELAQLYNSLDPSPFWDRDLDRNAAEFIEGEFGDRQWADSWHLIVHVRGGEADAATLQRALESYYDRLATSARRELLEHLRTARLGLLAGLALFAAFMGARALLRASLPALPGAVDEGLMILAWLTLWRPAEALAYGWLPLRRRQRRYERMRGIRVSVQLERPAGGDALPQASSSGAHIASATSTSPAATRAP